MDAIHTPPSATMGGPGTELDLTVSRICLDAQFGSRTVARHLVEDFLHSLGRLQAQEPRHFALAELTGGEIAIGRQIALFEEHLFRADSAKQERIPTSAETVQSIQCAADSTGTDIPTLVEHMLNPMQAFQLEVQQEAALALWNACVSDETNKLHIVHAGGIAALTLAMQNHPTVPKLQKLAAALLLNLAFFGTMPHRSQRSHQRCVPNVQRVSCDATNISTLLDLNMVQLLIDAGSLQCLLDAVKHNLFQVTVQQGDDDAADYVRTFACLQIPALCQCLMEWYHVGVGVANGQVGGARLEPAIQKKVGPAFSFVRRSLASLLDDPTIAPDTLDSFLRGKK
jgi:hypothetical protein